MKLFIITVLVVSPTAEHIFFAVDVWDLGYPM